MGVVDPELIGARSSTGPPRVIVVSPTGIELILLQVILVSVNPAIVQPSRIVSVLELS